MLENWKAKIGKAPGRWRLPVYAARGDIETQSGRYVNVLRPSPETITADDLAHALSMQCRFNGHIRVFYSVAEHCVRVAGHLPPNLRIHGILHDAAEAYLGDIVTPVKRLLFGYKRLEERMLRAIYARFEVAYPTRGELRLIKRADLLALREEAGELLPSRGQWHPGHVPVMARDPLQCLEPKAARLLWLAALGEELHAQARDRCPF